MQSRQRCVVLSRPLCSAPVPLRNAVRSGVRGVVSAPLNAAPSHHHRVVARNASWQACNVACCVLRRLHGSAAALCNAGQAVPLGADVRQLRPRRAARPRAAVLGVGLEGKARPPARPPGRPWFPSVVPISPFLSAFRPICASDILRLVRLHVPLDALRQSFVFALCCFHFRRSRRP